jgi:hypothetical protein
MKNVDEIDAIIWEYNKQPNEQENIITAYRAVTI